MAAAAAALGVWPTDSFCELIAVGALGLLLPWPGSKLMMTDTEFKGVILNNYRK